MSAFVCIVNHLEEFQRCVLMGLKCAFCYIARLELLPKGSSIFTYYFFSRYDLHASLVNPSKSDVTLNLWFYMLSCFMRNTLLSFMIEL